MPDEVRLTVSQVAQEIGESVHTVRNWLRDFRPYIPCEKSAGGYNLFAQEGINAFLRIKKMYREQNLSTRQIEAILAGAELPSVKDEVATSIESLDAIRELLEEQRQFYAALLQKLDEQRQQFEQFVQRRDELLMASLRELREKKQLQGKRRPWWKLWSKG